MSTKLSVRESYFLRSMFRKFKDSIDVIEEDERMPVISAINFCIDCKRDLRAVKKGLAKFSAMLYDVRNK